ncbi:MAG TPA: tetratricopeptide repeat protein [Rhizomicrobium sp.]|nr:tetratricopeptide repeat protein [Rhizomicrobium sp.]
MHRRSLLLIAGALVLISSSRGLAQSAVGIAAAVHNCQNSDLAPEARIEACTQIIHANLASHGILAAFYYNRAVAYEAARDSDHAKQDYEKALDLKPDFAEAKENLARLSGETPANAPPPVEVH